MIHKNQGNKATHFIRRVFIFLSATMVFCTGVRAGETRHVVNEFTIAGGLMQEQFSHNIVQDSLGYIYIGTWNGIIRFDGYRFDTFRPNDEEIITWFMTNILLDENDNIYCQIHNRRRFYHFDTKTCKFSEPLDSIANWDTGIGYKCLPSFPPDEEIQHLYPELEQCYLDRQGNVWLRGIRTLAMMSTYEENFERIATGKNLFIRSICQTRDGKIWQGAKPGYLLCGDKYVTPSGTLTSTMTQFVHEGIYSLVEDNNGRVLVGTRGAGLFRLTPHGGRFIVEHWLRPAADVTLSLAGETSIDTTKTLLPNEKQLTEYPSVGLTSDHIYEMIPDGRGGFLIATWGGGYTRFTNGQFTTTDGTRLRNICRLGDKVLVASTNGLLVYTGERRYQHLKFCDITSITVYGDYVYISVYGQGLFTMPVEDVCSETPRVTAFPMKGVDLSQPIVTTTIEGDNLWLFSLNSIVRLSLTDSTASSTYNALLTQNGADPRYRLNISEAHPVVLNDGRILLATESGSVIFDNISSDTAAAPQHIIITGVQYQGNDHITPLYDTDTITVNPDNRSFSFFVSTMDFKNAQNVRFQYRMEDVDREWNYSAHAKSIGFNGMLPGTYHLRIRAVSVEDQTLSVERVIVIDVVPRFYETLIFKILLVLLCIVIVGTIFYTYLYLFRIRHRHRALEEYCHTLLVAEVGGERHKSAETSEQTAGDAIVAPATPDHGDTSPGYQTVILGERQPVPIDDPSTMSLQDKQLLDSFMATFNMYISDSDKALDDYAAAMNMSYSSLYRKMKQLVGCTPIEFINRLRIQVATDLFNHGEQQISDVAYRVGFADPKYFSKCFKARTGMTPTQYIESRTPQ